MLTGENVIRGDNDSIKNLLEIFDGLLEYLKEEIIEESNNGGSQLCHCHCPTISDTFTISNYYKKVPVN